MNNDDNDNLSCNPSNMQTGNEYLSRLPPVMSRTQKGSSLASLALAVLGFVYLIDLSSGSAYYLSKFLYL